MKPHIAWLRSGRCWACYMPKGGNIVGLGFTARGAYDDWKYQNRID